MNIENRAGRGLCVGDVALTDFNGVNTETIVTIVEIDKSQERGYSQSGILFRVNPHLDNGTADSWYDADWFGPVPKDLELF